MLKCTLKLFINKMLHLYLVQIDLGLMEYLIFLLIYQMFVNPLKRRKKIENVDAVRIVDGIN